MAGGAIPSVIFFIGSVIAATGLIVIANDNVVFSGLSIQAKTDDLSRELRGSIEVVHVNASATEVIAYAVNTGSLQIGINETLLAVDGEWLNITSIVILRSNGDNYWGPPPEVLQIRATKTLSSGWHEAKILSKESITSLEYRFKR